MRRRILSILLSLAMCLSLVTPVYAAPAETMDDGDGPETGFSAWAEEGEVTVHPGETATLHVVVESANEEEVTYQWSYFDPAQETELSLDESSASLEVSFEDLVGDTSWLYKCLVTDPSGLAETVEFTVNVEPNDFSAWAAEEYVPVHPGETVTLWVEVNSLYPDQVTYSWFLMNKEEGGADPVEGATDSSLIVPFDQVHPDGNDYYCTVTDYGGLAETDVHFNVYREANEFSAWTEEENVYIHPDETATLSVSVNSLFPEGVTYQWYVEVDGEYQILKGYTSSELEVSYADLFQYEVDYRCEVTDFGGLASEYVYFFVFQEAYEFNAWAEEGDITVMPGSSAELQVQVESHYPEQVTYEWSLYDPENDVFVPVDIQGSSLTISYGDLEGDEYREYRCLVTDFDGVTQAEVYFNVYRGDNAFGIDHATESGFNVVPGDSVTMQVTASGYDLSGVTYQWYQWIETIDDGGGGESGSVKDGHRGMDAGGYELEENWEPMDGEIYDTLVLFDYRYSYNRYMCLASDGFGNYDSRIFEVWVDNNFSAQSQQEYVDLTAGEAGELTVLTEGYDLTDLTYFWYREAYDQDQGWHNVPVEGAEGSTLAVGGPDTFGDYYCTVTDRFGNENMVHFYVYINNGMYAWCADNEDTLYAAPHGDVTMAVDYDCFDDTYMTYQWYRRFETVNEYGDTVMEERPIEGATDPSYTFSGVEERTDFYCRVEDHYGSAAEVWFYVRVENQFELSSVDGTEIRIRPHQDATLAVVASGLDLEGVTYQWSCRELIPGQDFGDWTDVEGANGTSLTLTDVSRRMDYHVHATDRYGTTQDVYFNIIIENDFDLEPVGETDRNVDPHGSVTLQVVASGEDLETVFYQWYGTVTHVEDTGYTWVESGALMEGETSDTLTVTDVTRSDQYWCQAQDAFGNSTSVWFYVRVDNGLIVERVGDEELSVAPHGSATMAVNVSAKDMTGVTYRWAVGAYTAEGEWTGYVPVEGADGPSLTVNDVTGRADYQVEVQDPYGNYDRIYFRITVDNGFSVERVGDEELFVAPHNDVTMAVNVTATDDSNVKYVWSRHRMNMEEYYWEDWETLEDVNAASVTLTDVTGRWEYSVRVSDGYGNIEEFNFYIYLDNALTVERVGDYSVYVLPHSDVTLSANVSANDMSSLTYRWTAQYYRDGQWSDWSEIPGDGASLTLTDVTCQIEVELQVSDGYGNSDNTWFSVYVDNDLTVDRVGDYSVYVEPGQGVTLAVNASANDTEGLTYRWYAHRRYAAHDASWEGEYSSDDTFFYHWEEIEGAGGSTLALDTVTETLEYRCEVGDAYGNWVNTDFQVIVDNMLRLQSDGGEYVYVDPHGTATLHAKASGRDVSQLTYQWYGPVRHVDDDGFVWYSTELLEGETSDTLTVSDVTRYQYYYCRVWDRYYNSARAYFYVRVNNQFTASAVGETTRRVSPGSAVEMAVTVSALDMEGVTYQWYGPVEVQDPDGNSWTETGRINGATAPSLTAENVQEYRYYYCHVADQYGNDQDIYFNIYIENHLTVERVGDFNVPVLPHNDVTLAVSVTADDMTGLTYQWSRDGEGDIQGANSATYTVSDVTGPDWYYCTVTDRYGTRMSVDFNIYVDNAFNVERVGDEDLYVAPHGSVDLAVTVSANDMTGVTYRWYRETYTPGYGWSDQRLVNGAEGPALTVDDVTERQNYTVYVSDAYGNSSGYTFYIYPDNQLSVQPVGDTLLRVSPGSDVTMQVTVSALDTAGLTYQWYRNVRHYYGDGSWWSSDEELPGATTDTYTAEGVTMSTDYYCRVTDRYGNQQDMSFGVMIENHLSAKPAGESDIAVAPGSSVTLQVLVTGDDLEGVSLQWYGNWSRIEGETTDTLTVENVTSYSDYQCRVIDRFGNEDIAYFSVRADNQLMLEPVGDSTVYVAPGQGATLQVTVSALDMTGLTYRWMARNRYTEQQDGWTSWESDEPGVYYHWDEIPGADGSSLTLDQVDKSRHYQCSVTDRFGNVASIDFFVVVDNQLEARSETAETVYVAPHGSATLRVTASAADPTGITYQWYAPVEHVDEDGYVWNSTERIDGANTDSFTLTDVTRYSYCYCIVRDRYDNGVQVEFYVHIDNQFRAVSDGDSTVSVAPHGDATLHVLTYGLDLEDVTYQWYARVEYSDEDGGSWFNMEPMEGQTSDTLTVADVTRADEYYCHVMDKYQNSTNVWFEVRVENQFRVERVGDYSHYVEPHGETTLAVTVSALDSEDLTMQWYVRTLTQGEGWSEWTAVEGAEGDSLTVTDVISRAEYYVAVEDKYGNNNEIYFDVSVDNQLRISGGGTRYVNPQEEITLTADWSARDTDGLTVTWYDWNGNVISGATGSTLAVGCVTTRVEYRCVVADKYGNSVSAWFDLIPATCLVVLPACDTDREVAYGAPLQLEVSASVKHGALHYQWMDGVGQPLEGSGSRLIVTSVTKADVYRCCVSDDYGNSRTVSFRVRVANGFYADMAQDQVLTVDYGGSLTLRVEAGANSGELTYLWHDSYTGTDEAGGDTLEVTNITSNRYIYCDVSDQYGNTATVAFHIRINGVAPDSTQTYTAPYGGSVSLPVPDCGQDAVYTWYLQGDESSTALQTGDTNTDFVVEPVTTVAFYRCQVNTPTGIVNFYYEVRVDNGFSVDKDYYTLTVEKGGSATLHVTAHADDGQLSYTWYSMNGRLLEDATGDTLVTGAITSMQEYRCTVSDRYGNRENVWFTVYVDNGLTVTPVQNYESHLVSDGYYDGPDFYVERSVLEYVVPVDFGGDADLSVAISAIDRSNLRVMWNTQESGSLTWDAQELVLTDLQRSTTVTLYVYDGYGEGVTIRFAIQVRQPDQPVIATQPADFTGEVGDTAVFAVRAVGENLTYQWQSRTTPTGNWSKSNASGNKTAILRIPVTEARNGYQYRCVITDANGNTVTSQIATLHLKVELGIVSQPEDFTGLVGEMATFTVEAAGNGLTYQWQTRTKPTGSWNNSNAAGSKTATMSITVTAARDGYQYRCVITDAEGNTVTTEPATLHVAEAPAIVITAQPADFTGQVGTTATFTVAAEGEGLTYQWQTRVKPTGSWNNSNASGNKTDTLKITVTAARDGYAYRCVITDANGNTVTTEPATLFVVAPEPTVIAEFSFEEDPTQEGWQFIDADGDGFNWTWSMADTSMATYDGVSCLYSKSYDNNSSSALTPDNWAVSPALDLSDSGEYTVSLYAKGQDPAFPDEHFAIYAGTTADVSQMTMISQEFEAVPNYTRYLVDLAAFAGESQVYVAIRHFNCSDVFMLNIDYVQLLRTA